MSAYVVGYLSQDGISNGAIYALLAIALVVIFAVTRIIFIPQGDFVAFAALTYGGLIEGRQPSIAGLLALLAMLAAGAETARGALREGFMRAVARALRRSLPPLIVSALAYLAFYFAAPPILLLAVTLAVITALGPVLYRLVYAPIAGASILVLLIVSIALHLTLLGLGLFFFGPQGGRAPPLIDATISLGGVPVQAQAILIVVAAIVLMAVLFVVGERSIYGKALRAAAINPVGARLMGISGSLAGETAFAIAAFIGALSGVLICALTTIYYDTGFLLGLKGFVAGILGALANFPLAVAGAIGLGLLESFSSFFASAFKEVIVFSLIIPVLLYRSLTSHGALEDKE